MKRSLLFIALSSVSVALITGAARTATSSGQSGALVRLQASTPGVQQTGHANVSGSIRAGQFVGSGLGLTSVNASQLGGLAPNSFGLVSGNNSWTGLNTFSNAGNSFTGNGAGLTNLDASAIASGTIDTARLPNPLSLSGDYFNGVLRVTSTRTQSGFPSIKVYGPLPIMAIGTQGSTETMQVYAYTGADGVRAVTDSATGLYGETQTGSGVRGNALGSGGIGVRGDSPSSVGVQGSSQSGVGVYATSVSGTGVSGVTTASSGSGIGVYGLSYGETGGAGVYGIGVGNGKGVYGYHVNVNRTAVFSNGDFVATGAKSFRIDHPHDPTGKYLLHYCSESPMPQNFYNGTAVTDENGYAWVELPDYFGDINTNIKYQLTVIDDSDDFLMAKVTKEVQNSRFQIRTSGPKVKVSWEVKADRNDLRVRYSKPMDVVEKDEFERGTYQRPELYGQPKEMGLESKLHRPDPKRNRS